MIYTYSYTRHNGIISIGIYSWQWNTNKDDKSDMKTNVIIQIQRNSKLHIPYRDETPVMGGEWIWLNGPFLIRLPIKKNKTKFIIG